MVTSDTKEGVFEVFEEVSSKFSDSH